MIGPTWAYAASALAVFALAVTLAVVRASGSGSAPPTVEPAPADQPEQIEQTEDVEQVEPADHTQPAQPEAVDRVAPPELAATEKQADPWLGFSLPLAGACISTIEGHLPGALRAYRNNGIHEGLDFYSGSACIVIDARTPVLAAKDGVVIRADRAYVNITPADWARFEAADFAGEEILDELRGRQVWIDHGDGIVTRYAHLSAVAAPIFKGVRVHAGQVIGFVGESGQRESYAAPGSDLHLHFEIRIGADWLGEGLTPFDARAFYLAAFAITE